MKICIKCGCEKELEQFYKHPQMKDGYLNKCIECCKAESKKNRKTERARRYDRNRPNRVERNKKNKERMDKLKIENPKKYYEIINKSRINYRKNHPEKYKAVNIVSDAIRYGEIVIPNNCFMCGEEKKLEAHHPNYLEPLNVIWLCSKCHHNLHRNMRTLKRNSI